MTAPPRTEVSVSRVLILGGTAEAREIAARLSARENLAVTLSLAGRTLRPAKQPVPVRTGGFGGAAGLAGYLKENEIALLIDATHPFAARISANAAAASASANVPLAALRRPGWEKRPGDRWIEAASVSDAVRALGAEPRRVFAALGRQELAPLESAPQHFWLIRSVDTVEPPLRVPSVEYLLGRGPFDPAAEEALLAEKRIDALLCKNSGGAASYGKIAAARALGLPVFMVERPPVPDGPAATTVEEVLALADQRFTPAKRGE